MTRHNLVITVSYSKRHKHKMCVIHAHADHAVRTNSIFSSDLYFTLAETKTKTTKQNKTKNKTKQKQKKKQPVPSYFVQNILR